MELQDYLKIVWRRWLVVVIAILVGVGLGAGYTLLATPVYAASTQVVVSTQLSADASTTDLLQGANYARSQVKTYVQLVTQPLVLDPVIKEMGLNEPAATLASTIQASNPVDTTIVKIRVSDADPQHAADIANAVAQSFSNAIEEMETEVSSGISRVKVTTATPALSPTQPASPNLKINLALGLLLGLLVGVGLAIVIELSSTRVRTSRDVARVTDASIIGMIPSTSEVKRSALVAHGDQHGARAEAYRRLRTNLQFVDIVSQRRSFVITSTMPGEGKTTTAINLATTMAAAGMRVCLVEGDLRRPRIAQYLGIEGAVGLTSVLIGRADLASVLQPWAGQKRLRVLPCGVVPPIPTELLGSEPMRRVIESLEQSFDAVVVDVPPLLPVIDGALLATMTGGAVLVVGAGKVHRDQVSQAIESLTSVDAKLLGVVMTMVSGEDDRYSYTYSTYAPSGFGGERAEAVRANGAG